MWLPGARSRLQTCNCWTCSVHLPSAAGAESAAGSGPGAPDDDAFPSLLADISDDYLTQLEELANSLLGEGDSTVDGEKRDVCKARQPGKDSFAPEVVGQTPKDVETTGRLGNPAQSPEGHSQSHRELPLECVKHEEVVTVPETVYGTYDESTQTVTIIVPHEGGMLVEEAVQEVVTTEDDTDSEMLIQDCKDEPVSPCSSNSSDVISSDSSFYMQTESPVVCHTEAPLSDCGYESLDSPQSEISATECVSDLWNECFTELFPNLV